MGRGIRLTWCAALGLSGLLAAGCGDDCTPCDEACPSFLGTYYCQMDATMDSCMGWYLHEGSGSYQVSGQTHGDLVIRGADEYRGTLCQSEQTAPPRRFAFSASAITLQEQELTISRAISGYLEDRGTGVQPGMVGMITLVITDDRETCTLAGNFRCND
jgi:hypothetical protein